MIAKLVLHSAVRGLKIMNGPAALKGAVAGVLPLVSGYCYRSALLRTELGGDAMDPFLLAAATALITAMATDGWQEARAGVVALWRRAHPDRVPAIESELAEVHKELLAASPAADAEPGKELISEWQRKFRRLTDDHPELMTDLHRLVDDEWSRLLPAAERVRIQRIEQTAVARDKGTVYQAGRDQYNIGT